MKPVFDIDLLNFAKENLGVFGLSILILIGIILSVPKFLDSLGYSKSLKIKYLNEALDSHHIDDNSKRILSENLSMIYFKRSIGISVNEEERRNIIAAYDLMKGNFSATEIYYSFEYFPDGIQHFPREYIDEINDILERRIKYNPWMGLFFLITTALGFFGFIYFSIEAYYQSSFFTYEYLDTGITYGVGSIMGLVGYSHFFITMNRMHNTQRIIEYIQENPESN